MTTGHWNRRDLIGAGLALGVSPSIALTQENTRMIAKAIPGSDESLPVIGLGTYEVFDVDSTPAEIELRTSIVELLTSSGGSLLDTSPMYNRSEKVIGDVIDAGTAREPLF
ncbi:MAG: aldo/keto reductase, partial [Woeseiaceae bacterium]|nr:aldo/keto reductase [Woeseiaceae bacterium]